MNRRAFILIAVFAATLLPAGKGSAQLAKYFARSIEQRLTAITGTSIPVGSFMQKSTVDPNAGYANLSYLGGAEYTMLPLNGGIGLTASILASTYSVSMVPRSAVAGKYLAVSFMAGPRFETALASLTPLSLYAHGQIGGVYAKSPDLALAESTVRGGSNLSFGVSIGGGAVFDRVIDVGVRYFYSEARFGDNRLSADPVTRLAGLHATVGFLIF